jgi:hypothetical protein
MADKPKSFPAGTPFAGPKYDQRVVVDPVTAANIAGKQADTEKTRQDIRIRELQPQTLEQQAIAKERIARAQKMGTSIAAIEAALPQRRQAAQNAIKQLETLINHPGYNAIMGMPDPFKGGFGFFNWPGSPAAQAKDLYDTVKGSQFGNAIEILRGLGAMTEAEGRAATAGIGTLNRMSGEQGFKRGAQTYVDRLASALKGAQGTVDKAKAALRPRREDLIAEARRRGIPIPGEDE